jgi:CRP-like cAMP-binding protein
MRPRMSAPAERLYSEGDEIDGFYFMIKGVSAFIKEKQNKQIIGLIDPFEVLEVSRKLDKLHVF